MPRRKTIKKSNSSVSSKFKKKKLCWIPMEVTRVPLSPEQAVLSCCDATNRTVIGATYSCNNRESCSPVVSASLTSS